MEQRKSFRNIAVMLCMLSCYACINPDVSVCRHNAAFSAILHQAENPTDEVEICLGWNKLRREWHAQARYRKCRMCRWVFLENAPQFTNWESSQDDFDIKQTFTIQEWLSNYLKAIRDKKS